MNDWNVKNITRLPEKRCGMEACFPPLIGQIALCFNACWADALGDRLVRLLLTVPLDVPGGQIGENAQKGNITIVEGGIRFRAETAERAVNSPIA